MKVFLKIFDAITYPHRDFSDAEYIVHCVSSYDDIYEDESPVIGFLNYVNNEFTFTAIVGSFTSEDIANIQLLLAVCNREVKTTGILKFYLQISK